jgi:hypothetical protein
MKTKRDTIVGEYLHNIINKNNTNMFTIDYY